MFVAVPLTFDQFRSRSGWPSLCSTRQWKEGLSGKHFPSSHTNCVCETCHANSLRVGLLDGSRLHRRRMPIRRPVPPARWQRKYRQRHALHSRTHHQLTCGVLSTQCRDPGRGTDGEGVLPHYLGAGEEVAVSTGMPYQECIQTLCPR
jgi:hypothetical protein